MLLLPSSAVDTTEFFSQAQEVKLTEDEKMERRKKLKELIQQEEMVDVLER